MPSNLTPGVYNVYVDADNATALPGNGPVDASNYPASPNGTTNPSIALGTDEAVTQITVLYPSSTATTPASSSIVLGNSDTDSATVTGSQSPDPTGSVAFYECGPTPTPTPCTSASWTVFDNEALDGISNPSTAVNSVPFTPTSAGYWCFAGVYSGDSNYGTSADSTTDECFDVTQAGSTTATTPTNSTIVLGNTNTDGATVTGAVSGVDPTGSVKFYECGPTPSPTPCTSGSWTQFDSEPLEWGHQPVHCHVGRIHTDFDRNLVLRGGLFRRLELHG